MRRAASVRVRSEYGEVTFKCVEGKVPQGMIFVPYGPPTCQLMGQYTDGTGNADVEGLGSRGRACGMTTCLAARQGG